MRLPSSRAERSEVRGTSFRDEPAARKGPYDSLRSARDDGKHGQARHQHRPFRAAPCARPACGSGRGRSCGRSRRSRPPACRKRDDFYWTLHSVFVNRRDQREIFDQAFHVYWRNPRLLEKMMEMLLPQIDVPADPEKKKELSRRLQDALSPGQGEAPKGEESEPPEVEIEATFTVSDREVLQHRDFEQMTQAEIDEALRAIARLRLPVPERRTRRYRAGPPRPTRRLPRLAAPGAAARRADRAAQARAAPPAAAAGDPVRHLGLDGPLHAHVPAFHACDYQRSRQGLLLHLRHPSQQRHPRPAL